MGEIGPERPELLRYHVRNTGWQNLPGENLWPPFVKATN